MTPNLIGKIKSVLCKNFVTYEECVFRPSEFLNVIIGPNGTGKSTLVSAIVIGLGGDPKLLNRSTSVQDYIKNGKTDALIVIEIYNDNRQNVIVFERSISSLGKSEYKVNREVLSKAKYLIAVAQFKIQIGNLCQFLPQDRVHDFAKMNPQELFANTVKSVCSAEEIATFDKLKTLRLEHSTRKERLQRDMQALRSVTTRLEELKVILERHTRRQELVDKLKICSAKQNWLEVTEIEEKRKCQLVDKEAAKKLLEKTEKEYASIKRHQNHIFQIKVKLKNEADNKKAICDRLLGAVNEIVKELEQLMQNIKTAKRTFELRKRDFASARNDLQRESAIFQGITQDLHLLKEEGCSLQSCNSQIQKVDEREIRLREEIKVKLKTIAAINSELDEKYSSPIQMIKNRIERVNNVHEQKIQMLQTKFPKVYTAVQWVQRNQHMFSGKVYNPMLVELTVSDQKNAKYVENTIMLRDLLAFTCENKEDLSQLINELCIKQQLGINAVYSAAETNCGYKANQTIEDLNRFGFDAYLIDLIEGPASILNYLCSVYNIHQIPIGSEQRVSQNTEFIPSNIRLYYGGDKRYQVSMSKYSGEVSLMQSQITGKQLIYSVDINQVEIMKRELTQLLRQSDGLKNKRASIENDVKEFEVKREEIRNERREIESRILKLKQTMQKCEQQKKKVETLKSKLIDIPEAEKLFMKEAAGYVKGLIDFQKKRLKCLKDYQKSVTEKKVAACKQAVYSYQSEDLESKLREVAERKDSQQRTYEGILRALSSSEQRYKNKIENAKTATNGFAPNDKNFPFKSQFRELPNVLAELKELTNEYNARLDCMTDADDNIIREFERKSAEKAELEDSISQIQTQESDFENQINKLFKDWYEKVQNIVEVLNQQFSTFMASMQYVGEINLARKDEYDFDSYGIQIMVQYRREVPLQALDRYTQSGGERAVAIAIYSLSLQHLTHVPFRCVDEINQGMDSRNERKIFEMLVEETTKDNRSQYFFVTPKLLPGLVSNPRMMVHIVFNGKFVKAGNSL